MTLSVAVEYYYTYTALLLNINIVLFKLFEQTTNVLVFLVRVSLKYPPTPDACKVLVDKHIGVTPTGYLYTVK